MKKNNTVKSSNKPLSKLTKAFLAISLTALILLCVSTGIFFGILYLGGEEPDLSVLRNSSPILNVYDYEDKPIIEDDDGGYAEIGKIPKLLSDAFVAVEDKRFYTHHGIDYKRILGALVNNAKGNRTQGASTITQQLVKNVYLSSEQTFERKFKEMQLAIKIERQLSKEEIMEKYLNLLYFGSGEYGVKNAAQRFFGKKLDDLNVLECAMLAGIVKSPTKYNPINYYDNSIERARLVLRLMHEQGYVSEEDYNKYKNQDITIKNALIEKNKEDYFLDNAIYEVCEILNTDANYLKSSGIKIYTYYSPDAQKNLSSTVDDNAYYESDDVNSVAIVCDNATRGIKAISSRKEVNLFEYARQVGSTIKPLACYAPALDQGLISPATLLLDEPTDFQGYSPANYKDIYYGWTSAEQAVAKSLNVPAVKLMQSLSVATSKDYLSKMGIDTSAQDDNLALALGGTTYGITMIDLLGGYTTLANYGAYKKPTFIREITDAEGNVIYNREDVVATRVIDAESGYLMTTMLQECASTGTGKKLSGLNFDIACKTGTVSMEDKRFNSDIYCLSYTSLDTFLFWQGGTKMSAESTGGGATALMSKNFLSKYYSSVTPLDFTIPDGIEEVFIDKYAYDDMHEIQLASDHAPEYAKFKTLVSQKCIPAIKDRTYDDLSVKDVKFVEKDGGVTLSFERNPRLNYKIYKRTFTDGEILVRNINGDNSETSYDIPFDSFLGAKITLIPYYTDDDGKEIIGAPSKYYSGFLSRRFMD